MEKYIGFVEDRTCDAAATMKQIEELKGYELDLWHGEEQVAWNNLYNEEDRLTILTAIVDDRQMRVDSKTLMANRPMFAVVTIENNKIIRLEFYEGHDTLELAYDIRSKELQKQQLEPTYSE